MRLGYFAMPLHPPGADPATTMDGDLAQLATLDRLGYEEPASPTAATWRIARDVYVADTDARARREAIEGTLGRDYRDYFLRLLPKLRGFDMLKVDAAMPDAEVTLEYLCDNIWIVGSPDTVARKLAKLSGDVGGFGTLLVIAHEWTPRGAWERSMRLLKDKVVPRLGRRSRS
jgi:alkanesulfonate monooxygenase SsuD/methylene tetrahydromethanopterin reductase-like flavin-dependent oxidoreductase (luciferase family)